MTEAEKTDLEATASQVDVDSVPTLSAEDDKRLLRIIDSRLEIKIEKQTEAVSTSLTVLLF